MKKLAKANRPQLLDLLGERLVVERTSVRLYDAVLTRLRELPDTPHAKKITAKLQEIHDQEKAHEEWLEGVIRAIGGDTEEKTRRARIAEVEATGLERVVRAQSADAVEALHALLLAELADNAGWALLVDLADEAGDTKASKAFGKRLRTEERHLDWIAKTVRRLVAWEMFEPVDEQVDEEAVRSVLPAETSVPAA